MSESSAPKRQRRRRIARATLPVLGAISAGAVANPAAEVEFDSAFLIGTSVDLARFSRPNAIAPGTYSMDVFLNGTSIGKLAVEFRDNDQQFAVPCASSSLLSAANVDMERIKAIQAESGADYSLGKILCGDLSKLIPGASVDFDAGQQRVDLQVPQLYLQRTARGAVSPSQWSRGTSTFQLGYHATASHRKSRYSDQWSSTASVQAVGSFGEWSVRHTGVLRFEQGGDTRYYSAGTSAQRGVSSLKANLVLGQTYTDARQLESLRFVGAKLHTDERMLPASQTGYAPTVRGVAFTSSQVVIRQRGQIIYETTVAPGPFQIDDLYDTGYAGDLDVTVVGSDGRQSTFVVPYASAIDILRDGASRFSVGVGVLDESGIHADPLLLQGSYRRGLGNGLTAQGAALASDGYLALQAGVAANSRFGALSVDLTTAHASLGSGVRTTGHSWQTRYSKTLPSSATTFAVAAHRYNTAGFMTLRDTLLHRQAGGGELSGRDRIRSRLDISVSQAVGRAGSFSFSGSRADYRFGRTETTFSGGYSASWRGASFGLNASRTRRGELGQAGTVADTTYSATVTIPLGRSGSSFGVRGTARSYGPSQAAVSLSGTAGANRHIRYSASADLDSGGERTGQLSYLGSAGEVTASASRSSESRSESLSVSGGLVLHRGGLTLAQRLGETMGIVHAPGATGARISTASGVKIDRRGYAVVPYLNPYRVNTVAIDPDGTSLDIELRATATQVVPRAGTVTPITFQTHVGKATVIEAVDEAGAPLPFGAVVLDASGNEVAYVGQGGRILARQSEPGDLFVVRPETGRCTLRKADITAPGQSTLDAVQATCRAIPLQLAGATP